MQMSCMTSKSFIYSEADKLTGNSLKFNLECLYALIKAM